MSIPFSLPEARNLPPIEEEPKKPWYYRFKAKHAMALRLGDPGQFFPILAAIFGPIRHLVWLTIPISYAALVGMFRHQPEMWADLQRMTVYLGYWSNMLIGLIFTSAFAKAWEGVTMAFYGARPEEVGLRLAWGIFPRAYVARTPITALDFPQQRNCYLAPAVFRLLLFAVGMLAWISLRRNGTGLADACLLLSNMGLISFLFSSNPVWHADGYRVLAAQLRQPKLREHAIYVIGRLLTFRSLPKELSTRELWGLAIWVVLSALCSFVFAFVTFTFMAQTLTEEYYGLGAIIMVIVLVIVVLYMRVEGPGPVSAKRNERRKKQFIEEMGTQRARVQRTISYLSQIQADRVSDGVEMTGDQGSAPAPDMTADRETPPSASATPPAPPPPAPPPAPPPSAQRPPEEDPQPKPAAPRKAEGPSDLDDILAMPAAVTGKENSKALAAEVDSVLDSVFSDTAFQDDGGPLGLSEIFDEDQTSDLELDDLWEDEAPAKPAPVSARTAFVPETPGESVPPAAPGGGAPPAPPRKSGGGGGGRRPPNDPLGDLDRVLKMGNSAPSRWKKWRNRLIWIAILLALVWLAFQPYPYEVGGNFTVMPVTQSEARARAEGEIVAINVKEGDWVEEGQVLAVLSDWDQQRDVATNEADAAKLAADLQTMIDGATPQQIEVARQAVSSADVTVRTTKQNLDRQEALFKSGTISEKVVEDARDAYDAAVAARGTAQAQLDLVSAPTRETDIAAQKAAIDRNTAELNFSRTMLDYTRIRATSAGQIVTDLTQTPIGAHLTNGGLFTAIENNRIAIASVDVPETSIDDVKVGAKVEMRLWSDPLTSVFGTVKSVAPKAEERDYGWVVRVDVEVPNPDGHLQTNMTGYGKIRAEDLPVWQAFSQTLIGFFKIELWSWVP